MARLPHPWFWEERAEWCVNLNGQRQKLGSHPDGFPAPKKIKGKWNAPQPIMQEFHKLMAKAPPVLTPKIEGLAIVEVFDKFLAWCKQHREPRTYDWYRDHIQAFITHSGELARKAVPELKPFHVIEWVDSHGDAWSNAYRRGAIIAIQRPFNWAEELGYIPSSPIKKIPKPQAQRREKFIRPEEWEKIKNHYSADNPFRALLEFAWETGSRPQEVKKLEARHIDFEHHCAAFPPAEAKGKKRWRIIRMTPHAEDILKKQLAAHEEGVVFRNEDGNPWTKDAMNSRFARLKNHLGVKYACYDFRHGFAQDLLEQGTNPLAVAELMGHADGSRMVSQVYSHMNQANSHLEKILQSRAAKNQGRVR